MLPLFCVSAFHIYETAPWRAIHFKNGSSMCFFIQASGCICSWASVRVIKLTLKVFQVLDSLSNTLCNGLNNVSHEIAFINSFLDSFDIIRVPVLFGGALRSQVDRSLGSGILYS